MRVCVLQVIKSEMAFSPDNALQSRGHPPFSQTGSAIQFAQAVAQDDAHFNTWMDGWLSPINHNSFNVTYLN